MRKYVIISRHKNSQKIAHLENNFFFSYNAKVSDVGRTSEPANGELQEQNNGSHLECRTPVHYVTEKFISLHE